MNIYSDLVQTHSTSLPTHTAAVAMFTHYSMGT